MGEAKRRRAAGSGLRRVGTVPCVDASTGEAKEVRLAGDFTKWRNRYGPLAARVKAGEQTGCSVPCNGCTACCYRAVEVDPARERPENLEVLVVVSNPDGGGMMLARRSDGACVHLGPEGCTVYEHRPTVCRGFDCRLYSVIGMGVEAKEGPPMPAWVFDEPSDKGDRVYLMALRIAALRYVLTHPDGWTAEDALCAAVDGAFGEKHTAEVVVGKFDALPAEQRTMRYHSGLAGLDFLKLPS